MDGWQDMVLLTTVKSVEWWLSVLLFIALVAVGFDDLYRKQRAKDMLEATAGMGQVMLNDRAFCLRRANESISHLNKLIVQGDTVAQSADARSQAESHLTIRSMVIQTAERGPVLEAENPPGETSTGNKLGPDGSLTERPDDSQGEMTVPATGNDAVDQSTAGDTKDAENVKYSTLEHGGKKYKVPTAVRLLVQAQDRKIENQRIKINQLEERLRQYEKE